MVIRHSTPTSDPNPQVLGVSDTPAPQKAFTDYTIKKGDTVFSIAQAHSLEWTALATINNLKAPFSLKPGQIIQIPQ
jgi:LysM repeat protein